MSKPKPASPELLQEITDTMITIAHEHQRLVSKKEGGETLTAKEANFVYGVENFKATLG